MAVLVAEYVAREVLVRASAIVSEVIVTDESGQRLAASRDPKGRLGAALVKVNWIDLRERAVPSIPTLMEQVWQQWNPNAVGL